MHETTPSLRERTDAAVRASPTAPGWTRLRRTLVVAVVAAVFLAFAGAFGSGDAPWALRFAYWFAVMLAGSLFGSLVAYHVDRRGWLEDRLWLRVALVAVLIAVPFTAAVWAFTRALFGEAFAAVDLLWFFPPVLLVSAVTTAINYLVAETPPETHAAPAGAPPVRFLERLPDKLRGAEVYAVEAQDHYLRLHTSRGSDLILLRLADAVAELEGIEGAQTHRSWWVARAAVISAERADGRAVLTLKDEVTAPVSRTYAKALREAGWF